MWKDLTQLASGFLYLGNDGSKKLRWTILKRKWMTCARYWGYVTYLALGSRGTRCTYCSIMLLPPLLHRYAPFWGFPGVSDSKESVWDAGDLGWCPGWEGPLEKGMATHSSILAWRIPRTVEPGGLQSMGSQRVGQDWMINTFTFHFQNRFPMSQPDYAEKNKTM